MFHLYHIQPISRNSSSFCTSITNSETPLPCHVSYQLACITHHQPQLFSPALALEIHLFVVFQDSGRTGNVACQVYLPTLVVGAGQVAEIPVHELPANLGLRDVDQILSIVISFHVIKFTSMTTPP